jgi:hypothetical protein
LTAIQEIAGSEGKTFTFTPNYDPAIPEDQVFMKYSPSGSFTIFVTNRVVLAEWKCGQYYYFDTTPVPAAETPDAT